jgi:hypothetical protein
MISADYVLEIMSQKLNALINDDVMDELKAIAKLEQRSISQMANILLTEAVAQRLKQKADKMTNKE